MKNLLTFITVILVLISACAKYSKENAKTEKIENIGWQKISIPKICTFEIPLTLEIQNDVFHKLKKELMKEIIEIGNDENVVTIQPKGINDFDPKAMKLYSRIIVETELGKKGEYARIGDAVILSRQEVKELNSTYKDLFDKANTAASNKGMKMKIVNWYGVKTAKIGGADAIMVSFTRTMNNAPTVYVRMFHVQNNDCLHTITISYRESEKELWAEDFEKTIKSFSFKKR